MAEYMTRDEALWLVDELKRYASYVVSYEPYQDGFVVKATRGETTHVFARLDYYYRLKDRLDAEVAQDKRQLN